MFKTPILFIIFNRPNPTQKVFDQIKQLKPTYLFIAADGPRKEKEGDAVLCAQTRAIVQQIDWPCELNTLFREQNLGCGKAVSGAISWFFDQVEQGIILEDDCLPNQSFFTFCDTLLDYYKNEPGVMHIGGTNSQFGKRTTKYSYYFSKYPHIWGWATWRRAWEKYKYSFTEDDEKYLPNVYKTYGFNAKEIAYWNSIWDIVNVEDNEINAWDAQWTFSCWLNDGITIVPVVNLISNIGFGDEATHTKKESKLGNRPQEEMGVIVHPPSLTIDKKADDFTFAHYNLLEQPLSQRFRAWLSSQFPKTLKDKIKRIVR